MSQFLSIQTGGDKELLKNIALLGRYFPEFLADANRETAENVKANAQRNLKDIDAYDTGTLYNSVAVAEARNGLIMAVGTAAAHGPFIEFGTRPHFPPVSAIAAWCKRKGIPITAAFPIARAIARRGLPERPWLYPALLAERPNYAQRIQLAVAAGFSRLFRGSG